MALWALIIAAIGGVGSWVVVGNLSTPSTVAPVAGTPPATPARPAAVAPPAPDRPAAPVARPAADDKGWRQTVVEWTNAPLQWMEIPVSNDIRVIVVIYLLFGWTLISMGKVAAGASSFLTKLPGYAGWLAILVCGLSYLFFGTMNPMLAFGDVREWATADRHVVVSQDRTQTVTLTPWLETIGLEARAGARGLNWRFNTLEEERWLGNYLKSLPLSDPCYRSHGNAKVELDDTAPGVLRIKPCLAQAIEARKSAGKPPPSLYLEKK